ncbi:prolipoprotein diacylglyceryl transferase [Candidatus Saganbacteria bacterium]|nr:prolipoprotein diacylglyceryl transferase [Candidatus Saganbacteria bacterium]
MHPVLMKLGPFSFYSYGFMVALGFVAGILLAFFLAKKAGIDPEKIFDVALFVIVGSILGARLFYVIFYWPDLKSPWEAFMIWNGGLIFYGGVLFAIFGVIIASRIFKIDILDMLDVATPPTALGYAFGRIGCFLNGCCSGVKCDLPWAMHFPSLEGLRHPTQLYSSISGLIMLAVLLLVFYKRGFKGQVFSLGICLYAVYRFIVEYYRDLPRVFVGLTEAQIASVFIFVAGVILYGIFYKRAESE